MKTETKWEIIDHLRLLSMKKVEPRLLDCGICEELRAEFEVNGILLVKRYSFDWSEYNGNYHHPVDHPTKGEEEAYNDVENLWDNTPYGDARRRLCLHIANEMESEIVEGEANWYIGATSVFMGVVLAGAAVGVIALLEYLRWGVL